MSKHLIASVVVTSLTIAGFADADRIPITIPGAILEILATVRMLRLNYWHKVFMTLERMPFLFLFSSPSVHVSSL